MFGAPAEELLRGASRLPANADDLMRSAARRYRAPAVPGCWARLPYEHGDLLAVGQRDGPALDENRLAARIGRRLRSRLVLAQVFV